MKVRILTFEGADELDFVGPLEVFRRAAKLRGDIDVALVTLEPQPQITAAHGLRVQPDGVLEAPVDVLIVPGGGYVSRAQHGVHAEIARGELTQRIAALHANGTVVAGVSAGALALSAAGLLEGRPAITHHGAAADLGETAAVVTESRVVDDGDIVTCGGVTASIDLALWLVERFWGVAIADTIANDLEYRRSRNANVSGRKAVKTA